MKKMLFTLIIVLALAAFAVPVAFAAGMSALHLSLTPEQAGTVILGIVGAVMQLIFMYVPGASDWYQAQANKGLIMLGMIVLVAAAYFGLACTSLAAQLGIAIACTVTDLFTLLQAVYILASAQQVTYLLTKNSLPKRFK